MNNLVFTNFEKVEDIKELKRRIKEALELIFKNSFDENRIYIIDDLWSDEIEHIVRMLQWGKD